MAILVDYLLINFPQVGFILSGQKGNQHRFAGSNAAGQPDHFTRHDIKTHPLDNRQRAKRLGEVYNP